ncbi:NAD-dependent protein deacylase Sirt4 [Nilaparvata lugens]|uniref:NAD-dependent protein deacylase Sirt4 n=1 Tax=Nilaparvata lugens TaxID=108931 RepID=UPI00193CF4CE|nr:NAD-dependent protein deacylase Sirt4 [Nilaparvata lugens]
MSIMGVNKIFVKEILSFVPRHKLVSEKDLNILLDFIESKSKILVLTGAGVSTESGIPDYRSEDVGLYARSNSRPVQYQNFIKSSHARRRYWARNFVGWERFSSFQPNESHRAIRDLECTYNKVSCLITQNVDNLHFKAGSKNVIELHGTAFKVVCLYCNELFDRHDVQDLIKRQNPEMNETSKFMRPDGDVELDDSVVERFTVPSCPQCSGVIKPNIVFFGENVPKARVSLVAREIDACDSALVIGSSLSTYSGLRIAAQVNDLGKPVAVLNIGSTRADSFAKFKIECRCGDVLTKLPWDRLVKS